MSAHIAVPLAHGEAATVPLARVVTLVMLSGLTIGGVLVLLRGSPRARHHRRALLWLAGLTALTTAVASPLEGLAERWLAAHMVQHMLLLLVAGPLLVSANIGPPTLALVPARLRRPLAGLWRRVRRRVHQPNSIVAVAAIHAAVVAAWHVPVLYEAAVRSTAVHWLEHAMFLLAGAAFWAAVLVAGRRRDGPVLVAGLASVGIAMVTGLGLGLLMTFADTLWYSSYTGSAALDPVTDQQLAGIVMWSAGAPPYVAMIMWLLARALHHHGGGDDHHERAGPIPAVLPSPTPPEADQREQVGVSPASTGTPGSPRRPDP